MTRKVTWCAGSAIGFRSDVQPPFVKLYLYFYPGLAQITRPVLEGSLVFDLLTSNLPEAECRVLKSVAVTVLLFAWTVLLV